MMMIIIIIIIIIIFMSITHALMAFLALFSTVFKTLVRKSATDVFTQKKFSKDIFNSEI